MSCPRGDDDAAFVLGALDPPAMREFEAHLPGCDTCRRSVEELRALPGLLARLLPDGAGSGGLVEETERPDVLPVLLERVRSERRRARVRVCLVSVAAALLAAVAGAGIAFGVGAQAGTLPVAQSVTELTMSAAPGIPVQATLMLTDRGWGTSIDTRCRYPRAEAPTAQDPARETVWYGLYAVASDGQVEMVSSWQHRRGTELLIPGSVGLEMADIARLEVRDGTGFVVLRAGL